MPRREFTPHETRSDTHLPPRDLWRYDPTVDGRLPTPVDEHGLIDRRELIKLVKQTVDPTYDWKSDFSDIHHLYWPNNWYDDEPDSTANPQLFRNITSSKIRAARVFHNHLHFTTIPAEIPDPEVRYYKIQDHLAKYALSRSIRNTQLLLKRPHLQESRRKRGLDYHLNEFFVVQERFSNVPEAFRSIDLSEYEPESVEEILDIAKKVKLGKHAAMATVLPIASRRRSDDTEQSSTAA